MLRDFQSLLSQVYAIGPSPDIYDFLVTDAAVLAQLQTPSAARATEEKLLVHECEDEIGMLVFLDAQLLDRLMVRDPRLRLNGRNLADFCTVLEGISHFNYLAWNAAADKSVTLMELEMQAEVDKYIGARILAQQQAGSNLGQSLFRRLFDDPRFDENLTPEELVRYRDASSYAGQYCRSLEKRFPAEQLGFDMMRELRKFYRLPQADKVSHIQAAFFA